MAGLTLPEHLELLLADEPFADIYAAGPWRVPDGLAQQIWERGRDLAASAAARSLRTQRAAPAGFTADAGVAGANLFHLTSYLCGVCSVRGGTHAYLEEEFFGRFCNDPPPPDRDPLQWAAQCARWRPPGSWITEDAAEVGAVIALTAASLEVFEGVVPFDARRRALLSMVARLGPGGTAATGKAGSLDELEAAWAAAATDAELSVLPELAGPEGYLAWACEGLSAAYERIAGAVAGVPPPADTVAGLVLQAGLGTLPGALAAATGTDGYLAVQDRMLALREDFTPWAWHDETRQWLGRALAAGEIDACRAWLDMAVRLTGIWQGLPGEPVSPAPCYVPVGGFQRDVRAFARPRRVVNPVLATLPAGPAGRVVAGDPDDRGQPAAPEADRGTSGQDGDATAELADLPGLGSVRERLGPLIALAAAEAARRRAGVTLRPSWKNLAFAGPAGTGKSRVAAVLARIYQQAGLLSRGHLTEVSRAELSAERQSDTASLVHEAVRRALGGVLLISDAHQAGESPAEDAHAIRLLTEQMTEHRDGDLIVIIAGPEGPLRQFLAATPGLASRIAETIAFPPYEPGELTAIFASRARQAGLTLTSDAAARAAAVLSAGRGYGEAGSARLATRLLDRAAAEQARRVMRGAAGPDDLTVLTAADIQSLWPALRRD